jgi:putative tricarboxylic transport membrane protein
MQLSDRVTGAFLVALGGITAYAGSKYPPVPGQQIGPEVFPVVIGLCVALCGLLIAFGIGSRLEADAEADLAAHGGENVAVEERGTLYKLRVLIPPALIVFYVLAVDGLGFVPTAAIVVLLVSLTLGARLKLAIPLAILAPMGVHLVFYKLLRVPLPEGLLPMPWV